MIHPYPTTITDAVEILDTEVPDWYFKINFDRISMSSAKDCILGQIFQKDLKDNGYTYGLRKLFDLARNVSLETDEIFGEKANVYVWYEHVKARLRRKATQPNVHVSENTHLTILRQISKFLETNEIDFARYLLAGYLKNL